MSRVADLWEREALSRLLEYGMRGVDPVRREVARRALNKLLQDGRIHPTRIEEVVAKTRLELEKLADQAREASRYHTGEVTGPGTLICEGCGKEIHFHKAGRIPPCPGCQGTGFTRQTTMDAT